MSFVKTKGFKYFKNLLIGVGAAIVLMGALFKLESWEGASQMLVIGLTMEAIIFLFLGIIGPEPDYYWHKLYPGLDDYNSTIAPLAAGPVDVMQKTPALNGEVVERQLGGMLAELQNMSKSLSSLKALQEVDFSGTSDQIKAMSNFYTKLNEAMADLSDSLEDTKVYKENLAVLNKNIGSLNNVYSSLNNVYGNVISAMASVNR
ncbi:MAG: gliding motility protein GldL [Saprospiraceae bacterium]|nr:gliding motility protein GldL [Saprospiraceae bacterium]